MLFKKSQNLRKIAKRIDPGLNKSLSLLCNLFEEEEAKMELIELYRSRKARRMLIQNRAK